MQRPVLGLPLSYAGRFCGTCYSYCNINRGDLQSQTLENPQFWSVPFQSSSFLPVYSS